MFNLWDWRMGSRVLGVHLDILVLLIVNRVADNSLDRLLGEVSERRKMRQDEDVAP